MQTEVARPIATLWEAISEVPGWPDAPVHVRLRRLWPVFAPVMASLVLLLWSIFVREPYRGSVRQSHGALLSLEDEVAALGQDCSDQSALEIVAQAEAARGLLLESGAALTARLDAYVVQARDLGWEATAQTYDSAGDDHTESTQLTLIPARVRLAPLRATPQRFSSLYSALSRLTPTGGPLEMTRLSIRSDASGDLLVEVNIRAACRPSS